MIDLKKISEQFTQKFIIYGLAIIIVLMPFHAFLAISLGSLGVDRTLVQSWKEILILIMSFMWVIYQISKKKLAFKTDAINLLFLSIIFLSVLVSAFIRPGSEALLFGIKTNLVALALFFIAQIPISNKSFLKRNLLWLILIPGLIVSFLALLQAFIISPETLQRLGYNATTINPRQIIDGSINFLRSFSTLGGPNQLGAYLLIPLAFSLVYGIRQKKWFILLPSILILSAIVLSFSRSAWIGAITTLSLSIFLSISKKQKIYFLIISLLVAFIVGGVIASQIGTNERLQNVLLHGRVFEGRIEGSDQGRLESIAKTTNEVIARPFGHGLGSAGPASFRSENPIIPENWFLQIAYEIGIVGLLLYVFAFAALLGDFIRSRNNPLAIALFSITTGVLVINIFLQAWADSTLVLMMFALYGIYRSKNK